MNIFITTLGVIAVLQFSAGVGSYDATAPLDFTSKVGSVNPRTPQTTLDTIASAKALKTLNYFKRFITTGIWVIPPLDPFTVKEPIVVTLRTNNLKGTLHLRDLVVTGAAKVVIRDIQLYLAAKRAEYAVTVPQLNVKVHVDGENLNIGCVTYNASANIQLTLTNYTATGNLSVHGNVSNKDASFVLGGLESRIRVDQVEYDNSAITILGPKDENEDNYQAIADALTKRAALILGKVLNGYTIAQVQQLVLPG